MGHFNKHLLYWLWFPLCRLCSLCSLKIKGMRNVILSTKRHPLGTSWASSHREPHPPHTLQWRTCVEPPWLFRSQLQLVARIASFLRGTAAIMVPIRKAQQPMPQHQLSKNMDQMRWWCHDCFSGRMPCGIGFPLEIYLEVTHGLRFHWFQSLWHVSNPGF